MGPKWGKKDKIQKNYCHHFSGSKLPQKMFSEIQIFDHFWLKSAFLGTNSSEPKFLQHNYTHFVKKLGKSLESFFRKDQKTAKNDPE